MKGLRNQLLLYVPLFSIALLLGLFLFLWVIPKQQVKAYIDEVRDDFDAIQEKMKFYEGGFVTVSGLFDNSKEAFYEITTMRTYEESKEDTAQDIKDITELLTEIDRAQEKLSTLTPPKQAEPLHELLTQYYSEIEAGMQILLKHEQTQEQLLQASGDELNRELKEASVLFSQPNVSRNGIIEKYVWIASLAQQSVEKMREIIHPDSPTPENEIFLSIYKPHTAFAELFGYCAQKFSENTKEADKECFDMTAQYSTLYKSLREEREEFDKKWLEQSPITSSFTKAIALQTEIQHIIETEGKEIPEITPNPDQQNSPQPSENPSATPSAAPVVPSEIPAVNPTQ
jgi:hypothetical protein